MQLWLVPEKLKVTGVTEKSLSNREDVIEIKDTLTKEDYSIFKEFMIEKVISDEDYFALDIEGVSKLVRFGIVSHSEREDGIHIRGPIVFKEFDDNQVEKDYGDNFNSNISNQSLLSELRFKRLMELLINKGVLSKEEAAEVNAVPRRDVIEKQIDYTTF